MWVRRVRGAARGWAVVEGEEDRGPGVADALSAMVVVGSGAGVSEGRRDVGGGADDDGAVCPRR